MDTHYGLPMEGGGEEGGVETPETPMDGGQGGGGVRESEERERGLSTVSGSAQRSEAREAHRVPHLPLMLIRGCRCFRVDLNMQRSCKFLPHQG